MTLAQSFLLGMMVAWTPSLVFLGWCLHREGVFWSPGKSFSEGILVPRIWLPKGGDGKDMPSPVNSLSEIAGLGFPP